MSRIGLRAAYRVGRRQASLSRARSALVGAMVALPIAALVFIGTVIATAVPSPEERATSIMGTAELQIGAYSSDFDPAEVRRRLDRADLPDGSAVVGGRLVAQVLVRGGRQMNVSLIEYQRPIDVAPVAGMYELLDGRVARRPGEAMMHPGLMTDLRLSLGDRFRLNEATPEVTIVGTIQRPLNLWEPAFVAAPDTLKGIPGVDLSGFVIDLPAGVDPVEAARIVVGATGVEQVFTRDEVAAQQDLDSFAATTAAFAGTTLALFATGLIAAAAFVVGTRRQLRTLGLIAAAGGEPRHVRATVLAGGAFIGVTASTVGAALGVAGALAALPHLANLTGQTPGSPVISPTTIAGAIVLGTLAAVLAALGPARAAARLSTMDALASRTPPPRPAGRLSVAGAFVVAVGGVATGWATVTDQDLVLTAGMLAMVGGSLLAIPLLVSAAGRVAGVLPLTWRLAARDTARNGRRTGAALAAATLALAFPVAVGALSYSEEAYEHQRPTLGPEHALAFPTNPDDARMVERLEDDYRTAFPDATVVTLRRVGYDPDRYSIPSEWGALADYNAWVRGGTRELRDGVVEELSGEAIVLSDDVLRAIGAEESTRRDVVTVVGRGFSDDGVVHVSLTPGPDGEDRMLALPAVEVDGEQYYSELFPRFLIPRALMAEHGLIEGKPSVTMVRADAALTAEDVGTARRVAERSGSFVQTYADTGANLGGFRRTATAVAAVIGLCIVAVAAALVGSESRRDRAIMAAVGSRPGTRRRMAGASAALLAVLAGLLAVPTGFAPIAVIQASRPEGYPVVTPWMAIVVVAVVVPVLAWIGATVGARRPDPSSMLRPIM